jgi:hypothetical protein
LAFNNVGSKIGAEINKNKIWVTDKYSEMMVDKNSIPDGFVLGRLQSPLKNKTRKSKGTKWWNNGTNEIMSKVPPNTEYVSGRLRKIKS